MNSPTVQSDSDLSADLQAQVQAAAAQKSPLRIVAGGSKAFYGRAASGTPLSLREHAGIVAYEPAELVLTARAGTPLSLIEAALAERRQMLAFEPPHFGRTATLGGTVACGFSGPRRPFAGAARDFVLGVRVLNGVGESLRFGGRVMKNVAGYDVSRLMAGSLGTLGVLLEVSLKVLPQPQSELTLVQSLDAATAIARMNAWAAQPLPISAACYDGSELYMRLSGSEGAVSAARAQLGGTLGAGDFWRMLREQTHPFFAETQPLWRVSLAPATPPFALPGPVLMDWCGAQRWLRSDAEPAAIRAAVAAHGGEATLFRGGDRSGAVFPPLPPALAALHARLKQAFDPAGILNPQRLYPEW